MQNEIMLTGDASKESIIAALNNQAAVMTQLQQSIQQINKEVKRQGRSIDDIETEYPLLPPEADDLSKAVQHKDCEVMGGKKSNAYANKNLRQTIFKDIYREIKRQFGLIDDMGRQKSYKKLKRKYFNPALLVVDGYVLPVSLQNDVDEENDLEGPFD